jgi:putative addiction module CopG family antidote
MIVRIAEELEPFVRSLIEDGGFASEEAVIDTALRLFQSRDEQAMLADLRREIAVGLGEADRGELSTFDPHATLERVRAR